MTPELTDYEATVIRLASASPDGLTLSDMDSATLRRHARNLEKRGLLVSEASPFGAHLSARIYRPAPQPTHGGASVAAANAIRRGGEVGASLHAQLFGQVVAKDGDNG